MFGVAEGAIPAHAVVLPKGVSTFFVKIGFISQRGGAQPIPQIHTAVLIREAPPREEVYAQQAASLVVR